MEFREVKPEKKKASVVSGFPAHFPEKMWWESVGFKGEEIGFGFITGIGIGIVPTNRFKFFI